MIAVSLAFALATGAQADPAPWWNDQWQYRLVVSVPPADLRAGINTARLHLSDQSALCAEDGRDVRVVNAEGEVAPHSVEADKNAGLMVDFLVPGRGDTFYVYYGNPQAEAVRHTWPKSLGGLTLETRDLVQPLHRARDFPDRLKRSTRAFGRQRWARIADLENPFGPDDRYLSIYEGVIYCPEEGQYTFAINADDLASFFIGSLDEPLCWRRAGIPSVQWRDPRQPEAVRTRPLRRGLYPVRCYHAENGGAQLVRLGWKTPSSDEIVTVPARAFVEYLPAEIVGRQSRWAELNPFFVARHLYNLQVNSPRFSCPNYLFESRSGGGAGADLSCRWDFGDGTTATGPRARYEFADMLPHRVTLTVRDSEGREAALTRTVPPPADPVKRIALRMELQSELAVVPAGGTVAVRVLLKNNGLVRRSVALRTVSRRVGVEGDEPLVQLSRIDNLAATADPLEGWLPVTVNLPLPDEDLHVVFRLLLHGRGILEEKLAVLSTHRPLGKLLQDPSHNLRDTEGRLAVLRLANVALDDVPDRKVCDPRTGRVKVLVLDERVAGPVSAGQRSSYVTELERLLSERYPRLRFDVERPAIPPIEQYLPVRRFIEVCRHAVSSQPNLVVLVCQPEVVLNAVPPATFETYLVAGADQILSQTRAHVVLVTPTPLPGRPRLAAAYARIAKRTGLRKGLAVADLYSRFLLTPGWEGLFQAGEADAPSYSLSPNPRGQAVIGQEIFDAIVSKLDRELSTAARRARDADRRGERDD